MAAVTKFLCYVMEHASEGAQLAEDAKVALARYWSMPAGQRPNNALLTDASASPLRAKRGAAKRER